MRRYAYGLRRLCVVLAMACGTSALVGCAATSGSSGGGAAWLSGLFDDHREFRRYVADGKWDDAYIYYQSHSAALAEPEYADDLASLAKGLGETQAPHMAVLGQKLASLPDTLPPLAQWGAARAIVEEAQWTLNGPTAVLTGREEFRTDAAQQVAVLLKQRTDAWRDQVEPAFLRYDHAQAPLFFEQFPVDLTPQEKMMLLERSVPTLPATGPWRVETMQAVYKDWRVLAEMNLRLRPELDWFFVRVQAGGESLDQLSVGQLQEAWKETERKLGQPLALPMPVLVMATRGGEDAIARVDPLVAAGHAARPAVLGHLPMVLRQLGEAYPAHRYVLVLATSEIFAVGPEYVDAHFLQGERRTGQTSAPNPAYDRARADVERARRALAEAESSHNSTVQQSKSMMQGGGLSGLARAALALGAGASGFAVGSLRNDLREAESELASTPAMISEDSYAPYEYAKLDARTEYRQRLGIYLVDTQAQAYRYVAVDRVDKKTGEKLLGVAQADRSGGAKRDVEIAAWQGTTADEWMKTLREHWPSLVDRRAVTAPIGNLEAHWRDSSGSVQAAAAKRVQSINQSNQKMLAAVEGRVQAGRAAARGASGSGQSGSACPTDMRHLDASLPQVTDPPLVQVRTESLRLNVRDTLNAARREGRSQHEEIAIWQRQASDYWSAMDQAIGSAHQVDGTGASRAALREGVMNGRLGVANCGGERNSFLCSAMLNRIVAESSQAMAQALACHVE